MSTESAILELPRVALVYVGRRITGKGKVAYAWLELIDGDVEGGGEERWYAKQIHAASIGAVFHVPQTETGSVHGGYAVYERTLPTSERTQQWAAQDLSVGARLADKALETKALKVTPLDGLLEQVAEIAHRLTPAERRAFAVRILEAIR